MSLQPGLTVRAAGTPSATVPTSSLGKGFPPWQIVGNSVFTQNDFEVLPHPLFSSPKWYQIPVFF